MEKRAVEHKIIFAINESALIRPSLFFTVFAKGKS